MVQSMNIIDLAINVCVSDGHGAAGAGGLVDMCSNRG